jgi:Cu(I)/Ag(I) efflux system membrane fusion protein
VSEAAAGEVRDTDVAEVTSPAYPGRSFKARIDYVYAEADPTSGGARVRLVVKNSDQSLRPSMYVSVLLSGIEGPPVVTVPRDAVMRGARTDHVIVALGDGRFAPRTVKIGSESADRVAILEGLKQGERVVTAAAFLIDSESNLRSSLARYSRDSAASK